MRILLGLLVCMLLVPYPGRAQDGLFAKSYALVVGIDRYAKFSGEDLPYPEKDARAMAKYLQGQGFEIKTLFGAAATQGAIMGHLRRLAPSLREGDRFLFFFSGHGETREFGRRDYGFIVPADGTDDSATWISMDHLEVIADRMNAARHQLFVFDSCFGGMFGLKGTMSGYRAGVPGYIQKIGSRKARQYLTAGGKDERVVADGPDGYSWFTGYLLKALNGEADTTTDGWITASELEAYLGPAASNKYHTPSGGTFAGHEQGDFLFRFGKSETPGAADAGRGSLLKGPTAIEPIEEEYLARKASRVRERPSVGSPHIFTIEPGGHVWVAGSTSVKGKPWYLVDLADGRQGYVYGTLLAPRPTGRQPVPPPAPKTAPVASRTTSQPFRDCDVCPEMVVVPAGSFLMGSPDSEKGRQSDEGPVHKVSFARPFAIGRYEVTFDEWDACARDGGCTHGPDDQAWGRGRRPVVDVIWNDAQGYVEWLSRKTGEAYRLPSEAEWEYAARAGTTTPFSTGACIDTDQANYDGNYGYADCPKTGKYHKETVEVGAFDANPWGLFDVHGNAREWVQDCWNDSYRGAPTDGSAWEDGDCGVRALRGGSWNDGPRNLRSANRYRVSTDIGGRRFGFRVARTY